MTPLVTKKAEQATKAIITLALAALLVWGVAWLLGCFYSTDDSSSSEAASAGETSADVSLYSVTAYCPCEKCCGKWADGRTASGRPAKGKICAAPPEIPFGTVLQIPGYGKAECQDRGGAITGNRLDVLFPTHAEALEWGVRELMVEVVK